MTSYILKPIRLLACIFLSAFSAARASGTDVPLQVLTVDVSGDAASRLLESHRDVTRQSADMANVVYYQRHEVSASPWYWGAGARTDQYWFNNRDAFPISHLQDYAAQLGVEYMVDGRPAASLIIRPGIYFQSEATWSAWDIPMDFVTGIPITHALNGVIGVSEARFYPRPIPVAGLSWAINAATRLDAVYPEPALTFGLGRMLETRIGGRLVGGGFRADDSTGLSKMEYYAYRTGVTCTWAVRHGLRLVGEAGYEAERVFDLFGVSRKIQANGTPYIHAGVEFSR